MIQSTKPNPFAQRGPGHFAALEVTNGDYHNTCDGISNSMLSVFLDDPALFYGMFVTGEYTRSAPTPDQEFGSLFHCVVLDGVDPLDCLMGDAVIIPRNCLNGDGHRKGKAWLDFAAGNIGKRLLKEEELAPLRETADRIGAMVRNIKRHPVAGRLLYEARGANEYTIEWTDPTTGLLLRSRLDRWTEPYARLPRLILDLKTAPHVDPKNFSNACWRWGYHRQAAFYRAGAAVAEGGELLPFVFVAVRKTPPYSVACYELSEEFIEAGEREVASALLNLAACRDSGIWTAKTASQIFTLEAPRWSKWESDWEVVSP